MEDAFVIVIITGTAILLLLASFIFAFMWMHQKRNFEHSRETDQIKKTYGQEILKVQLEVKEQTLNTVSQEIHDNIGQVLSLVKLNLSSVTNELESARRKKINEANELVSRAIQDLRNMAKAMSNEYIVDNPLSELLKNEVAKMNVSGAFRATFIVEGMERTMDSQKQVIVYRIIQECLSNIFRYAECSEINISLRFGYDNTEISIIDNGKGFDPLTVRKGLGISNMRKRALLIGAQFSIESSIGRGTKVHLSIA